MNLISPDWVPEEYLSLAVPLSEKIETQYWVLHYYEGFDTSIAIRICNNYINKIAEECGLCNPVNVYLYLVDYPHDYSSDLTRKKCNNGYLQRVGQNVCTANYSIVIFRKLFWPKVLLHEILHILWQVNLFPNCTSTPKYDEALVEFHAVNISKRNNYINLDEYQYWLKHSQQAVVNNVMQRKINFLNINNLTLGGRSENFMEDFKKKCLSKQQTYVYEYLFMSTNMEEIIKCCKN